MGLGVGRGWRGGIFWGGMGEKCDMLVIAFWISLENGMQCFIKKHDEVGGCIGVPLERLLVLFGVIVRVRWCNFDGRFGRIIPSGCSLSVECNALFT